MTFKRHHPLVFRGFAATIPLGLAYLAGYLQRAGHTVGIVDYQVGDYDIGKEIRRFRPDILGLSICSPAVAHALDLAATARAVRPDLLIVAGGAHVTAYRTSFLASAPDIDVLVIGEGELTIVELVRRCEASESLTGLPGLVRREDGQVIEEAGESPIIKDLGELPMMPLELFEVRKYFPLPGTFRRLPSIPMATTRGCPFKCTFCNSKGVWSHVRTRPPLAVADEIERVVRDWGAREIYFVDELFTVRKRSVQTLCEELLRRNIRVGWKCCSRVDTVDAETLKLMKRAGCFMISYGVESGDDRILKIMKKGTTTDQVRSAFRATKAAGIDTMAFFMLNSYGETKESIEKTLQFSRELQPDFVNFELFKPFPGIEMRRQIEADPLCTINREIWDDWNEFTVGNQVFYTQGELDEAYLSRVYEHAIKGFYLRPSFIAKSLVRMKSFDQFKSYCKTFVNMLSVRALPQDVAPKADHVR
jgi:radical SAM superfamily enzyme YgiQ (UPF0313 family)